MAAPGGKRVEFTQHALTVMAERRIAQEWVSRTLASPEWTESDPTNPGLKRAFRRIPEFGDRVLRVVYYESDAEWRVVTEFFDRTRRASTGQEKP
jgi:hypothetical protein